MQRKSGGGEYYQSLADAVLQYETVPVPQHRYHSERPLDLSQPAPEQVVQDEDITAPFRAAPD